VDHRPPEILGASLSSLMPQSDVVSRTVILDHDWMIDGKVGCSLLKIRDRVPTHVHQVRHKLVRAGHGRFGIVNKLRLDFTPGTGKTFAIALRQSADLEAFHPPLAFFEDLFRFSSIAGFRYGPLVFGTKAPSDLAAPLALEVPKPNTEQNNYNHRDNDHSCRVQGHLDPPSTWMSQPGEQGVGGKNCDRGRVEPVSASFWEGNREQW